MPSFLSPDIPDDAGLVTITAPLPADHQREYISYGPEGTAQTINRMQDLVTQGKRDFRVRKQLYDIIKNCPNKDYYAFAKAFYEFCRDEIKYVFDPNGVELVESPYSILESKVADCDSIVMLLATLCEQAGMRCRFVTIRADFSRPEEYSHVYMQVFVPKHGWVGADPTMPNEEFGWEPDKKFPRTTWPASKDTPETSEDGVGGLSGMGLEPAPQNGFRFPIAGAAYSVGALTGRKWQWQNEDAIMDTLDNNAVDEDQHVYDALMKQTQMSGLGDTSSNESLLYSVLDGTLRDTINSRWDTVRIREGDLFTAMQKAQSLPAGPDKTYQVNALAAAQQANSKENASLQAVRAAYDSLVHNIQIGMGTLGFDKSSMPQLLDLGEPIEITVTALLGIAVVVYGVVELSKLLAQWAGVKVNNDSLFADVAKLPVAAGTLVGAVGDTAQKLAVAAVVAGGLYAAWMFWGKKRA